MKFAEIEESLRLEGISDDTIEDLMESYFAACRARVTELDRLLFCHCQQSLTLESPGLDDIISLCKEKDRIEAEVDPDNSPDFKHRSELVKEAEEKGLDVHTYIASVIFQVPYGEVKEWQRNRAKACSFGAMFGMKRPENVEVKPNKDDILGAPRKWAPTYDENHVHRDVVELALEVVDNLSSNSTTLELMKAILTGKVIKLAGPEGKTCLDLLKHVFGLDHPVWGYVEYGDALEEYSSEYLARIAKEVSEKLRPVLDDPRQAMTFVEFILGGKQMPLYRNGKADMEFWGTLCELFPTGHPVLKFIHIFEGQRPL